MRQLIVLMVALAVVAGCGPSEAPLAQQIVGTWRDEKTGQTQTFTADGYRSPPKGLVATCWSITGNKLYLSAPMADSGISTSYQGHRSICLVAIDGETLRITVTLAPSTHTRVDADDTLSAEEEESIAQIKGKCPKP